MCSQSGKWVGEGALITASPQCTRYLGASTRGWAPPETYLMGSLGCQPMQHALSAHEGWREYRHRLPSLNTAPVPALFHKVANYWLYDKCEPEFYVLSLVYLVVKMVAVLAVFVIIYLGRTLSPQHMILGFSVRHTSYCKNIGTCKLVCCSVGVACCG